MDDQYWFANQMVAVEEDLVEPGDNAGNCDFPFGALAPKPNKDSVQSRPEYGPEAPPARPCIPPGDYNAEIVGHKVFLNYRFPGKRSLHLEVAVFLGVDEQVVLTRFLNFYDKPGTGTDYYKEWVKVNNGRAPQRSDRMSPRAFVGKFVRVRVRTVEKDKDGDPLPGDLRYSVIDKILGPAL